MRDRAGQGARRCGAGVRGRGGRDDTGIFGLRDILMALSLSCARSASVLIMMSLSSFPRSGLIKRSANPDGSSAEEGLKSGGRRGRGWGGEFGVSAMCALAKNSRIAKPHQIGRCGVS